MNKIEKTVELYVNEEDHFTSVDITNRIKKSGIWVSNTEVAKWLRNNFDYRTVKYEKRLVTMDNGKDATVYFPENSDTSFYVKRDQETISYKDFKQKYENNGGSSTTTTNIKSSSMISAHNPINSNKKKRFYIPAVYIKQIGLAPGDYVEPGYDKININISSKLQVHKDGRLSVPNKTIDNKDHLKVKIEIDSGKLVIEEI